MIPYQEYCVKMGDPEIDSWHKLPHLLVQIKKLHPKGAFYQAVMPSEEGGEERQRRIRRDEHWTHRQQVSSPYFKTHMGGLK